MDERELAELWRTLRLPPESRPEAVNAAKRRVDDLLSAYEMFAADPNDTTYERAYTETVAELLAALRPPVVEQQPRAWECTPCSNVVPWKDARCDACDIGTRERGIPLYAGALPSRAGKHPQR